MIQLIGRIPRRLRTEDSLSKYLLYAMGVALLLACNEAPPDQAPPDAAYPQEISFRTSDSIEIIGDLYASDTNGAIILLFHQGGSNARAEYGTIIPRLLENNYNVLAIDQRMGGQYFGLYNRTLVNIHDHGFDNPYGYCDAYNNLEGALDFVIARGFTGRKILWGSSYSASLAIQLAAKRPDDVDRVLAFSAASGRPLADCDPASYFPDLTVPALILSPPDEMQRQSTQQQFELAKQYNLRTYAAQAGVHGSSMLVKERVGSDVEETWKVVLSFLEK